jgi:hypothetical protein
MTQKNTGKKHEAAVDAYLAKLKTFLMTPDHGDGSWPDIPREELDTGNGLVHEMMELKWGTDVDRDSPVRVRIWERRQVHLLCDWAYIQNPPRDEETEPADERQARFLRNIQTISSASAACAEELRRVHLEMADIHARELRRKAAFDVHVVEYAAPQDNASGKKRSFKDDVISVHPTAEAAEQFIVEQEKHGMTLTRTIIMSATPGYQDSPTDKFAEYRAKVNAQFEKVVPSYETRQALNLQFVRTVRKAENG